MAQRTGGSMSKKTRKAQLRYAVATIARHDRIILLRRIELDALTEAIKGIHTLLSKLPEAAWSK
jgi:hypothetical protein